MRAILPVDFSLVDQSQVGLVDEGGGLQGVVGIFTPHLAVREPVQFSFNQRQEFIERGLISVTPVNKQRGNVILWRHYESGSLFTLLGFLREVSPVQR